MRLRSWFVVALVISFASGALAQQPAASARTAEDRTDEAKGLFSAGRAAFDAGRYQDAVDYFQRSYALSGRAELLYNLAISYDRLRDDNKALDAYERYLSLLPDAPNRAEVETRAAAIRAALQQHETQAHADTQAQTSKPQSSNPGSSPAVPSPAQVAASQAQAQSHEPPQGVTLEHTQPEAAPAGHDSLLRKWWFWTAVGVVVVGGVTATAIALSGGQESATPLQPTSGVLVTTLRRGQ